MAVGPAVDEVAEEDEAVVLVGAEFVEQIQEFGVAAVNVADDNDAGHGEEGDGCGMQEAGRKVGGKRRERRNSLRICPSFVNQK